MQLVAKYIRHMPKTTTCEEFLRGVTAYVNKHYKKRMMTRLQEHPEDRLTCSAVVFSRPKPYEAELAARRAKEVQRLLDDEGKTVDELCRDDIARTTIIPRMIETMKEQNISYAVIDGFHIPRQHVRIIPLDFQPWELVLASDGYPILCTTLADSEEQLRIQKENDPLNIGRFQATKAFHPDNDSFDDRAYLRLRV